MSDLIRNSGVYQRLTSSTEELDRMFKEVDEKKNPPDLKKTLLLMGLGTLSWISTYSGLLELIQANSGDIAFTYKLAIGFAVAMLMLMIVYILDQLFAPLNWLLRTIFIFGYIFLTIISVGFGFGFYWKFLESRSEATKSAESAIGQVQGALQGGQTRLEQLEATLTTLTALSLQKAKEEREKGNSCPNSRPGDGPRRRMRDNDAKSFTFSGDFVTKRAQAVANDIKGLNGDMAKIASRHPSTIDPKTGTRNAFLKQLNQRLDLTITRFNAFRTDPQLRTIRNNLAERSNTTIFPDDRGGTFKCPDNQIQSALRGAVQAIDQLPLLQKPKINAIEGSEATIEAFRRLSATLAGLVVLKLPPSEDDLRELRKKAVRSLDQKKNPTLLSAVRPGLSERDYIPLSIAVFVDFCLLLVSINRPMDRLKSLVPVMKDARDGPISGILSSFHATHFAGIREEFSLFQHVVFDWGGHYYVAVPLASNDIQAQYLANLFVSLEGRGIVDRAMIPPTFIIRGKLKRMGSSFAEHRAFRLYKFRNGAWSNIVLDAVMGAAKDLADNYAAQHPKLGNEIAASADHKRSANFDSLFDANADKDTAISGPKIDHDPLEGQKANKEAGKLENDNLNQNPQQNNQQQEHSDDRINGNANGIIPAPLEEQPFLEMPRLLRNIKSTRTDGKTGSYENKSAQDNVISPSGLFKKDSNQGYNDQRNSQQWQHQNNRQQQAPQRKAPNNQNPIHQAQGAQEGVGANYIPPQANGQFNPNNGSHLNGSQKEHYQTPIDSQQATLRAHQPEHTQNQRLNPFENQNPFQSEKNDTRNPKETSAHIIAWPETDNTKTAIEPNSIVKDGPKVKDDTSEKITDEKISNENKTSGKETRQTIKNPSPEKQVDQQIASSIQPTTPDNTSKLQGSTKIDPQPIETAVLPQEILPINQLPKTQEQTDRKMEQPADDHKSARKSPETPEINVNKITRWFAGDKSKNSETSKNFDETTD